MRKALAGLTLAVDCANGATSTVGPALFTGLGWNVVVMANHPDGRNINLQCGSTHPQGLARLVIERGCDLGIAFDGDGDRAIFVDHRGRIVDGDAVLLMCALQLQREGRLRGGAIVATVMSNIGLEQALTSWHRACAMRGRRQVCDGRDVGPQPVARRRAVGHVIFSTTLHWRRSALRCTCCAR